MNTRVIDHSNLLQGGYRGEIVFQVLRLCLCLRLRLPGHNKYRLEMYHLTAKYMIQPVMGTKSFLYNQGMPLGNRLFILFLVLNLMLSVIAGCDGGTTPPLAGKLEGKLKIFHAGTVLRSINELCNFMFNTPHLSFFNCHLC